jgi:hypothetical protein
VATDSATLDGLVREAVEALRTPWRAVTAADYESLAQQASPDVARVHCVPRRNLDSRSESVRTAVADGHVSVVVVPANQTGVAPQPSDALRTTVAAFLEPRRLVTTRLHVVGPTYVPVQVALTVVRQPDASPDVTEAAVLDAIRADLDLLKGGPGGTGWPFGRAVLASEIYRTAAATAQVAAVIDVTMSSTIDPSDSDHEVAAIPYPVNADGEQVGLRLGPHQLPSFRLGQSSVFVGTGYQPLVVNVGATPMGITAASAVRQAIRDGLRTVLDPAHGGPGSNNVVTITIDALRTAVLARLQPGGGAAPLASLTSLELRNADGDVVQTVSFGPGQLAELRLSITLPGGTG